MANEWQKVELYGQNNEGNIIRYTIADGASVSKGQLLALTDPRTASAATDSTTTYAGVAAHEKVAGDGSTSIGVWTDGIFEATASQAIILGYPITGTNANYVKEASGAMTTAVYGTIIGRALEAAGNVETINVRLHIV